MKSQKKLSALEKKLHSSVRTAASAYVTIGVNSGRAGLPTGSDTPTLSLQAGRGRRKVHGMKLLRRKFLQFAGAAAIAPAFSHVATAQSYPSRPITMIVAIGPGSPSDVTARIVAERMKGALGQPIIVENISGANGSIGVGRLARATPDGYTIDLGFLGGHVLNGAFYSLPYDVLNDFEPISPVGAGPLILYARKTMPAKDLHELIAWLKANPDKASIGITAVGPHLTAGLFKRESGTRFAMVPYRGAAPALQDLMAGQIDLYFDGAVQLPLVRGGSLRAFAVTSETRLAAALDIPTFAEMGLPAVSYSAWNGLFAPKGTPKDIIARLNAAAVETLVDPAVRSRLADLGGEIFPRERQTPEALGALVRDGAKKWWPLIKEFGIAAE
jgi:tripartite-type tricarboxylate transporter receptor subunit TctC